MNRPQNRQPHPERPNQRSDRGRGRGRGRGGRGGRGGGRGGGPRPSRGSPATPQQASGTVPTVHQVTPGASVFIVLKEDQPTGSETQGVVQDILTRGNHPRGIKVRLQDGQVGRVQRMGGSAGTTAAASSSASSNFTMRYTDVRNDEFLDGPPPRSLADFMPEFEEPAVARRDDTEEVARCPFCDAFSGDEAAVTFHIDREHLT